MSFLLQRHVWATTLDGTTKLVLLRLADHAADDGSSIWPSIPSLAGACGLSQRTVQNVMKRLREIGALVMVREADYGSRRPVEYRLDLVVIEEFSKRPKGCTSCTGAANSPVQEVRGPVQQIHPTGAATAPKPTNEPINKPTSVADDGNPAAKAYRWRGKVVGLNEADYSAWRSRYHAIPDFDAELAGLDAWWDNLHPEGSRGRSGWFHALQKPLAKTHQQWTLQGASRAPSSGSVIAQIDDDYRRWGVQ